MSASVPKAVVASVITLGATHAFGLWEMAALSLTLGVPLWMPFSALAFCYSFLALVLSMVMRGRRWARTIYAVIAVFAVISALGRAADMTAISFVASTAKVLAVALLYLPASESWFRGGGSNNSFKPNPLRGSA